MAKLLWSLLFACVLATPARALCIHNGRLYAKTSLAQEFRESRWVVRAHVVAADYHWSDEDESWTFYRLRVVGAFKGPRLRRFTFFTTRDSGGFYLDADGGTPDLDHDYLLFLQPAKGKPQDRQRRVVGKL